MKNILDITIATADNKNQFIAELRELAGRGYEPHGGVCVANASDLYFAQTMVRYEPEPEEPKTPSGVDWDNDQQESEPAPGTPAAAPGAAVVKKALQPKGK